MAERCNCDASCGENRCHNVGDPECRYRNDEEYYRDWPKLQPPPTMSIPPVYQNKQITIPVGITNPDRYQMVLKVSEAIQINEDLIKLQEDNTHMRKILRQIYESASEADIVRLALKGLN